MVNVRQKPAPLKISSWQAVERELKVKVKPQIGWILDFRIFLSCVTVATGICKKISCCTSNVVNVSFCRDICVSGCWFYIINMRRECTERIMLMTFWFGGLLLDDVNYAWEVMLKRDQCFDCIGNVWLTTFKILLLMFLLVCIGVTPNYLWCNFKYWNDDRCLKY